MLGDWITPKELFETLGITENSQASLRSRGRLPYSKTMGRVFYDSKKIIALFEQNSMQLDT